MNIPFYKYDGAGNDFILIDNRAGDISLSAEQIAHLCHRRMGVGADGLILLNATHDEYDFAMRYYNSDGLPADMCGNGGRCIAAFAHQLGLGTTAYLHRFVSRNYQCSQRNPREQLWFVRECI